MSTGVGNGCLNNSRMTILSPIPEPVVDENVLSLLLTGLEVSGYIITIRVNRLENNKKVSGRVSPSTYFLLRDPIQLPAPLYKNESWDGNAFLVSWELPTLENGVNVTGIIISHRKIQAKACPAPFPEETIVITRLNQTEVTQYRFSSLEPFTEYSYSIALEYAIPEIFVMKTPTVPVPGLKVEETGTTWLFLSWTEYPCEYWNSPQLLRYEVELSVLDDSSTTSIIPVLHNSTSYNLTSLAVGQIYSVRIRPVTSAVGVWTVAMPVITDLGDPNLTIPGLVYLSYYIQSIGKGAGLEISLWTDIGVPPSPPTPEVLSLTPATVTLRLLPVMSLVGPITSYEIWVSQGVRRRNKRDSDLSYQAISTLFQRIQPISFKKNSYYDVTIGGDMNKSLSSDSQYQIYYVVISQQNGVTESNYSQVDVTTTPTTTQTTAQTATHTTAQTTTLTSATPIPCKCDVCCNHPFHRTVCGWVVAIVLISVVVFTVLLVLLVCYLKKKSLKSYQLRSFCNRKTVLKYTYDGEENDGKELDTRSIASSDERFSVYYNPADEEPLETPDQIFRVVGYWSLIYEYTEERQIVLNDKKAEWPFDSENYITFEQEFNNLPRGQQYSWAVAAQQTADLNRVSHLVAYDHNRVVIGQSPLGTDYINATHIKGYNDKCSYIATTSPFNEESALQFWQMIYEQKVTHIVMMTNFIEAGITKCYPYWPTNSDADEMLVFGKIGVELVEVTKFAHFCVHRLEITDTEDSTATPVEITHFQLTSWPESGVPDTSFQLIDFILTVRTLASAQVAPLVVHCGTGELL
ncbi:hypothetical protein EB796_011174 [Bugula neritina]|uniref:protein-tyrosine-phosphatase n=1 Tax=Bugula neritina TaxID=10212 RepID=A0A7J7JX65_BUGNE|nr:hypothetical protein EB796_011174 [Bugula neritina]